MVAVAFGFIAESGVDDELNFPVHDGIHNVWPAHRNLVDHPAGNAVVFKINSGSACGYQGESDLIKLSGYNQRTWFIPILDADKDRTVKRQILTCAKLGFGIGRSQIFINAHDFTGGFHLRAKQGIHIRKPVKRHDRLLDRYVGWNFFCNQPKLFQGFAQHDFGCQLCKGNASGLADKRNGSGRPWIDFQNKKLVIFDSILNIHQPDHI